MGFFHRIGASGAALCALTASALAADLPSRVVAPVAPPLPVAEYNWSGAYIGVSAGGDFVNHQYATTSLATGFALDPGSQGANFDQTRFRLGGYLGYNWQINQFVLGVEGDGAYDFGDRKSTMGIPGEMGVIPPNLDMVSVDGRFDASARGRLGVVLLPSLLFYATGGAAFRDASISASCAGNGIHSFCSVPEFQTYSGVRTGWTVGGGLEGALTQNLIARVEYRYSDFGSQNRSFFGTPNGSSGDFFAARTTLNASTVSVGLAYKLNLAPPIAPVVARY